MNKINKLVIGDLVAQVPIIQGGMGVGISLNRLASAVANEGGIGVIATAGVGENETDLTRNFLDANTRILRHEIRTARSQTKGLLGVNIMVALSNYAELVKVSIEEKIDFIFSGAGIPLDLPAYLNKTGHNPKLVPIVSSGKGAAILTRKWIEKYNYLPDAIVVEGPLAGGHLGFKPEQIDDIDFSLENLIVDVIERIKPFEIKYNKKIPVIAAGGIYTGKDIFNFMKLGAAGVQMATRFVTTHECDASDEFKQTYINAKKEDIAIIKSPVGMPGRAIRNKFTDDVIKGEKIPFKCPYHCIITCEYKTAPYCIAMALRNAKNGKLEEGFAFAGANAYRTNKIISVKELIDELLSEYAVCE